MLQTPVVLPIMIGSKVATLLALPVTMIQRVWALVRDE